MAVDITPFIPEIQSAAQWMHLKYWIVRYVLGEVEDAKQTALLYCMMVGWQRWDKWGLQMSSFRTRLRTYWENLSRQGIWSAVRRTQRQAESGLPKVLYETEPPYEPLVDGDENLVLARVDVAHMLHVLSLRERDVIVLRYGLDGSPERDYKEIGQLLNLTPNTVRQYLVDGHNRLRCNFKVECG